MRQQRSSSPRRPRPGRCRFPRSAPGTNVCHLPRLREQRLPPLAVEPVEGAEIRSRVRRTRRDVTAISTASIGIVTAPRAGSIERLVPLPPGERNKARGQRLLERRLRRVRRGSRAGSGSTPEVSSETARSSRTIRTTIRTYGDFASTSGRRPTVSRNMSTIASFVFWAAKWESVMPESRAVASTAIVRSGENSSAPGDAARPPRRGPAGWARGTPTARRTTRLADREPQRWRGSRAPCRRRRRRIPWSELFSPDRTIAVDATVLSRFRHHPLPLQQPEDEGRDRRPVPRDVGRRPDVDAKSPEVRSRRPDRARGVHRLARHLGGEPEPARLPREPSEASLKETLAAAFFSPGGRGTSR